MTKSFENFFAIEGQDGTGKRTQMGLLAERLRGSGYSVGTISFPRYGERSARNVERYWGGDFGPPDSVDPYVASLFYAYDRFVAKARVEALLTDYDIVISDRYVASNLAPSGRED